MSIRILTAVCSLLLLSGSAFAGDPGCSGDPDAKRFEVERDREERVLLAAWLNGQLPTEEAIVPLASRILAWEAQMANLCSEANYLERDIHLLNQPGLTIPGIPGRLFLKLLERNGIAPLRPDAFPKSTFVLTRRGGAR